MPTLIIARHAKAEAPAAGLSDADRALELIGRKASTRLGQVAARAGINPDLALISPALRTQQTWNLMAGAFSGVEERVVEDLYETHVAGMVEILQELGEVETVVMVGHEPTSSALAAHLAGPGSDKTSLQRVAHGLPTGTAAVIDLECDWASVGSRCGRLVTVLSGRDVEE
ncbi:SixA phosphatase family protein [Demequina lignilytica]|uniref:Histidine phosphatase family protein n=1 Tax=Demequina lignilytica TaxID=3051663 RepID=A0AAW7M2J1_9MICO|nr:MULTISPECIES: histidine phosphatase family protein [unclassified Demequina]MDN4479068.1 histidine phosphatase family protein [Demequina sp. SYSU T00039-1]MDN4484369.1 histidine phosphatase family protein [Demequina sp. SYSU T0a273]MDN4489013.1 histidine phosphatase family protein [Demequina sp. SYSU T00039]MDN4491276.1 histidine phosphatase family protein [Demequina sp. SYSU T00068]